MKKWEDKEQIQCIGCGHRWILISNKEITDEQHQSWFIKAMQHHAQIQKEEKEE